MSDQGFSTADVNAYSEHNAQYTKGFTTAEAAKYATHSAEITKGFTPADVQAYNAHKANVAVLTAAPKPISSPVKAAGRSRH